MFPKGFMTGAATAAHQVEGNNIHSDYWLQEQMPHSSFTEPSGIACDHYHRYEEDIRMLAEAGLNAYRFSVEWARIEPEEGVFSEEETEHYRRVIACCRRYGVEPVVTLMHFTSPAWLIRKGGWEAESTVDYFRRYAAYIAENLGGELRYVCTINEANMGLQLAAIAKRFELMAKQAAMRAQQEGAESGAAKQAEGTVQVGMNFQKMMENMKFAAMENAQAFGTPQPQIFVGSRTPEGDLLVMKAHAAAREAFRKAAPQEPVDDTRYLKILPQVDERDQLSFLDDYFSARQPEIVRRFIALNRGVSILADCSAGSNASTMLCMDREGLFYRKYAFGADGEKLAEQLRWLRAHEGRLPLCEILRDDSSPDYCCYDMRYSSEAVGFFPFLHSHPVAAGERVLLGVLDAVERGLYRDSERPLDEAALEQYIQSKVTANLERLETARELHELLGYETLVVNHREYRNLPALRKLFAPEHLREVFACDRVGDIHGDLTVENIICTDPAGEGFYLIDPNTGNLHDSPFLDYAKLLQSLHGGYEFMMKTGAVSVSKNRVDFISARSAAYDELFAAYRAWLGERFSPAEQRSIFHHELVHWLRLLPYKLRKDGDLAPMFYAGFIMVANDVYEWFEHE